MNLARVLTPLALLPVCGNSVLLAEVLSPQKLAETGADLTVRYGVVGFLVFSNMLFFFGLLWGFYRAQNVTVKQVKAQMELTSALKLLVDELSNRPCLHPTSHKTVEKFGHAAKAKLESSTYPDETPT